MGHEHLMAYLGAIVQVRPLRSVIWTINPIAAPLLPAIIGQYATYGGYIYVG